MFEPAHRLLLGLLYLHYKSPIALLIFITLGGWLQLLSSFRQKDVNLILFTLLLVNLSNSPCPDSHNLHLPLSAFHS